MSELNINSLYERICVCALVHQQRRIVSVHCAMRCLAAFAAPPCAHATRSLVNKLSAEHSRSGRKLTATKASTAAAEGELRDAAGTSLVLTRPCAFAAFARAVDRLERFISLALRTRVRSRDSLSACDLGLSGGSGCGTPAAGPGSALGAGCADSSDRIASRS